MADTIKIRAGNKANMPTLADREIAYVRDEEALYVGTPGGNKKVSANAEAVENRVKALEDAQKTQQEKLTALETTQQTQAETLVDHAAKVELYRNQVVQIRNALVQQLDTKLTATPMEAMNALDEGADMASVVNAINSLITAMKNSGVMST